MTLDLSTHLIFIGASLGLLCILASIVSRKLGAPILLVFLVLGMLAGEDGPGGIAFNDFGLAFLLGNLALAIIILDGGLGTRIDTFQVSLKPALSLATLGVVITAAITGLAVHWILGLSLVESILIGAIVGSTDAAAVFGLIRSAGLQLKERTGATLEIESGTNDPMAIFLTVTLVQFLIARQEAIGLSIVLALFQQMGLGLLIGFVAGKSLNYLLNTLNLPTSLYPLFTLAAGLSVFGLTNQLGGSGFLAIYVLGVLVGNAAIPYSSDIHRFHDGMAWLSQIGMFLVLGLLITPSHMVPIILPATGVALALIFVARPIAVWVCLLPFHFPLKEQVFISWCGLRGAVPIILALFPSLAGLENTEIYFELVFFVVLISLILQGWSIAPLAKRLKIQLPKPVAGPDHLTLSLPTAHESSLHCYEVIQGCNAEGASAQLLPLAEGTQSVGVVRNGVFLLPKSAQTLNEGDYLIVLSRDPDNPLGALFADSKLLVERQHNKAFFGEFTLSPDANLGELAKAYGFSVSPSEAESTIAGYLHHRFHGRPVIGDSAAFGDVEFTVREISDRQITAIGIRLHKL